MFQSVWRSFHNLKDVGVVQVKVIRAEGLMAADVTGKTATLSLNSRAITSAVVTLILKKLVAYLFNPVVQAIHFH